MYKSLDLHVETTSFTLKIIQSKLSVLYFENRQASLSPILCNFCCAFEDFGHTTVTHHADLRGHQVTEPVEPFHVRLQVGGLLVVAEASLKTTTTPF